ncbi:MAG: nucleotidyl transferase AbiEii/AbiGii toxin family protein [Gammaproteobacteria bacterium]
MPFSEIYHKQAALLVRILPFVAEEPCFALKGGTAINLFVRDMPRLSVDIDLTYLPIAPRPNSLAEIDAAMKRIAQHARSVSPAEDIMEQPLKDDGAVTKLIARGDGVQIKIEVNHVLRGSIYDPEIKSVSPSVEDAFGYAEIQVLSFADLYAGKIVAALDRQHPRDLFDVRDLLAKEGLNEELRRAFIVYLISHNRPMSEVLAPRLKDITEEYKHGFEGMTETDVSVGRLVEARDTLIEHIVGEMPEEHRRFLMSFERGVPNWALLGLQHIDQLPAVKWRQHNLDKLDDAERAALVSRLEETLGL